MKFKNNGMFQIINLQLCTPNTEQQSAAHSDDLLTSDGQKPVIFGHFGQNGQKLAVFWASLLNRSSE
jgi:hypothetical protein